MLISSPAQLLRLSLFFPDRPYLAVSRAILPSSGRIKKTISNRNITLNTSLPVNCQGMYTVNQLLGNVSIGTASLNLAFRVSSS